MTRARFLFSLCAALAALFFLSAPHSAFARQTPSSDAPPAASAPASPAEPTDSAPAVRDRLAVRMRLGDGLHVWRPTRRQLGIAYAPGGSDQSAPGQFHFVVSRAALRAYLDKVAPYARHAPHNARVVVAVHNATDDGAAEVPAKVLPGLAGAALDTDAAVDLIQQTVQANPAALHVVLPVRTQQPKISTADVNGIDSRIGYFVTRFNPGDAGRTQTVRLAITLLDNRVIAPRAIFSINQAVGERTAQRGFGQGHVFINGKMEKQLGGGMCQVATTLFNAAMLADLKIVERHQHVRTIPYAAPGRDATVYWGQKDFKFQNNTDAPVYLSYKTTRSHAIAALFGKGVPGRKVALVNHSKRLGPRHYTGVFYRVISYPDGRTQKDPPFYSAYKWTPALDFNR